jgi:excisionase family DNA binding protein
MQELLTVSEVAQLMKVTPQTVLQWIYTKRLKAYKAGENIETGEVFVRLFIGKGKDLRCLTGYVELPRLQKTDGIFESEINLNGIGGIKCETKQ